LTQCTVGPEVLARTPVRLTSLPTEKLDRVEVALDLDDEHGGRRLGLLRERLRHATDVIPAARRSHRGLPPNDLGDAPDHCRAQSATEFLP
jgi:hypothetical protein